MTTTATTTGTAVVVLLALLLGANDADAYSKYGRSCKDIGCLSSEVCVMAEDPCSIGRRDACGTYPTCKKISNPGGKRPPYAPSPVTSRPAMPRPTPPTPPPRNRYPPPGDRNSIDSIFGRPFGGFGRTTPFGSGGRFFDRTTKRPAYQPGGQGYYDSKRTRDEKGNVEWRFSG